MLAHLLRQHCRGRFLPDFLAPPLQRTFPLETMDCALSVTQNLNLDVARLLDHLLDIEPAIAECGFRFGAGLRHQRFELGHVMGNANAAATAAGRRLDHHRKADGQCNGLGLFGIIDAAIGAGHDRNARGFRRDARRHLVAHDADGIALGSDEDQACGFHRIGEAGVLGQEAIARMHGIGAGGFRGLENVLEC